MAFYEDAEQAKDKQSVKNWKDQFDNIIADANRELDTITNDRWGPIAKYVTHINLLKSHMTALKAKYNLPAVDTELDSFISQVDSEVSAIQARWNNEVYDILNP